MLLVKKRMANGRSMYVWIGMYVVPVPMFLFVLITASVACEIEKKRRRRRKKVDISLFLLFLVFFYSDWLFYKLENGLVMPIKILTSMLPTVLKKEEKNFNIVNNL